eukprot:210370-Pelagomonas_calceolata.AAC.1
MHHGFARHPTKTYVKLADGTCASASMQCWVTLGFRKPMLFWMISPRVALSETAKNKFLYLLGKPVRPQLANIV